MPQYFAFLRGINVGGHRVKMERLRELFAELGCENVSTFIASGNVIFECDATDEAALERRIEKALREALGYEAATFLRSLEELRAITAQEPFPPSEVAPAGHTLFVLLLRSPLKAEHRRQVEALRTERDDYRVIGREIYWLSRGPTLESMVTPTQFAKATGKAECTARNLNTLQKLLAKYNQAA